MKSYDRLNLKSPLYRRSKSPIIHANATQRPSKLVRQTETDLLFQRVCCPNCRYLFRVINNENLNIHKTKQKSKIETDRYGTRDYFNLKANSNKMNSEKIDKSQTQQKLKPRKSQTIDQGCQTFGRTTQMDHKAIDQDILLLSNIVKLSSQKSRQSRKNISIYDLQHSRKKDSNRMRKNSIYDMQNTGRSDKNELNPHNQKLYQPVLKDRSKSRTPTKVGSRNELVTPRVSENSVLSFSPKQSQRLHLYENVKGPNRRNEAELIQKLIKTSRMENQINCMREVLEEVKDQVILPSYCKMLLAELRPSSG